MRRRPRTATLHLVLPWETLRRLLGLPSDMSPPGSVELVRMALDEPRRARLIGMALSGHTPKEPPAGMLMAALDSGALAPELAAELLGSVGHRAGYRAVRGMLFDAERSAAAAAAGVAMARILGQEASADLSLALRSAPTRQGREGAALGLTELGDVGATGLVTEAGRDGRIRVRTAARCLAGLPFDAEGWVARLDGEALEDRRLATEVVYVLVRKNDDESRARLEALGEPGRRAVRRALIDEALTMLPDKRDALLEWAGPGESS
ncbi:MAG TPA: hypothetical protein RMH99_11450 [Sandaracinaceae bacterium LLY-WYZ-13_1]|nr:hypothetical protein [Sandaracinaceae bacterium LLY-WYZ-13_1]